MTTNSPPPHRPEQLRRAGDQLATVLESLDLEDETRLADDVIEAIRATERAYEQETETRGAARGSHSFIFPTVQDGIRSPHER